MASQVRLDKCQAVYAGNIESVVHTAELQNGMVINLGDLKAGERELREVAVPATATLGSEEVLLVYSPEVMYDERKTLADFTIPAGTPARAYHLTVGDIFTITDDGITGSTVVGQYVVPANGSLRLTAAADLSGGTRFAGKVIAKETFNGVAASVIQVVKA